ncbi:major capsid protein [Paenibacillus albiflavus]|uniref:Major capsid protein n=1 Tax=Paenibacillus albiflavus TaxID=2545760 RepID=A0A4R4E336_9BACL|nr:major capsid protein [Paenibacillus albiflavus]TCZ73050.1 major capsid protein [Paenibacillus albiflavus]
MSIYMYDPRTMLAAIENMLPVRTFLKETFFPNTITYPTEQVDVDFFKSRRKMAPFVSSRLPGKAVNRDGFKTRTYTPPTLKPVKIITQDDLKIRAFGDHSYIQTSPEDRALRLMARDLQELDEMTTRREEWMAAQMLFNGKVDMIGEGVKDTLDFDFTNKAVLTSRAWNKPDSDPISDLRTWRLAVIQKSGMTPNAVVMASDVTPVFLNHPKLQAMFNIFNANFGNLAPKDLPNGVTFICRIAELGLDVYSYDEWYLDDETDPDNPVEKPMVPSGTIALASTNANFTFAYGAVTLIDETSKSFYTVEASRVPYTWIETNPAQRFMQINSRPLPMPTDIDSWYIAKVI